MKYKRSLFWFRNNLRLKDNLALHQALEESEELILIYVLDERLFEDNPLGNQRANKCRLFFINESLQDLHSSIKNKGGGLLLKKGKVANVVSEMFDLYNCDGLFTTDEVGTEEKDDLRRVSDFLLKKGKEVKAFSDSTLYHPEDIPWPINKLPSVFTQFRKENEKQTEIRQQSPEINDLSKCVKGLTSDVDLLNDFLNELDTSQLAFKGGEQEALKRLKYYLWETDYIKKYKETRNGLLGYDFSSKLSAYLASGCISAKTIYVELKKYENERGSNQSTYWLFFELVWRDYFHFILKKHGADLFSEHGIKEDDFKWKADTDLFNKWAEGKTGVPFIDANMKELNTTGYMSNRGRQLVASFLTHDLEIDWRWGAWYFEEHLLDYDVASNWGNWAYVAGVGNDPRENRYFNILSQAKKYDSQGDYVRYWLPELEAVEGFKVHKIPLLDDSDIQDEILQDNDLYLHPIVDMKKWDH